MSRRPGNIRSTEEVTDVRYTFSDGRKRRFDAPRRLCGIDIIVMLILCKNSWSWASTGIFATGEVYPFLFSPPLPCSPPFLFSLPLLSPPLSSLFLPVVSLRGPLNLARGSGERCKLPQRGSGQNIGRKCNLGIF